MNLYKKLRFCDLNGTTIFHGTVKEYIDREIAAKTCRPNTFNQGRVFYGVNNFRLGKRAFSYAVKKMTVEAEKERLTQKCRKMTPEEWLEECRFYRSSRLKCCYLPDGQSVILKDESTVSNFRIVSRDFLLHCYKPYAKQQ